MSSPFVTQFFAATTALHEFEKVEPFCINLFFFLQSLNLFATVMTKMTPGHDEKWPCLGSLEVCLNPYLFDK